MSTPFTVFFPFFLKKLNNMPSGGGWLVAAPEVCRPHRLSLALVGAGGESYADLLELPARYVGPVLRAIHPHVERRAGGGGSRIRGDVLGAGAPVVAPTLQALADVAVREVVVSNHVLRVVAGRPLERGMHAESPKLLAPAPLVVQIEHALLVHLQRNLPSGARPYVHRIGGLGPAGI